MSDLGRVKSLERTIIGKDGRKQHWKERILKPGKESSGYLNVVLYKTCKIYKRIHRLVLETFVGKCPIGMKTLHLNNNRADPRLINLKWGTHSENERQKTLDGTSNRGERNGSSKLKESEVRLIKKLLNHEIKLPLIAKIFKVQRRRINDIKLNNTWGWVISSAGD